MFKLLAFLLRVSPSTVILAIVASVLAGVGNTALLAVITNQLSKGEHSGTSLVIGFIGLCVVMLGSRAASMILLTRLTLTSTLNLRMRLSRQILSTPLRDLEKLGEARLLTSLTDDVPVITVALSTVPILAMNAAIVTGCLSYLGWLSWKLLIGVLVYMIVGAAIYQFAILKASRFVRLARESAEALMNNLRALTDATKELKIHQKRREVFLTDMLEASAVNLQRHNMMANVIFISNAILGQALIFALIGLLLFGLSGVISVSAQILTSYTVMMLYMMGPLESLLNSLPNFNRAVVAMQKVNQLGISLAQKSSENEIAGKKLSTTGWESLELINATHTYYRENQENSFMLGPINMQIEAGEILFLTGGNGSGKTTLAKLILGLYAPETGQVKLNGEDITDENRESYRQYFSVVFTDFYLFDSLIGLDQTGLDERAQKYLSMLQLDKVVEVKDGKLSTIRLSQGQRKRLALLTAYLEDRPIYLFDEWAADQDPLFKEVFYYQLLPELKSRGKTVIVISHDDHYYHVADRVVKLDYGQIEYDQYSTGLRKMPASI